MTNERLRDGLLDEECVLPYLLVARAQAHPDKTFAVFEDGEVWTWADTLYKARELGAGLRLAGVAADDKVIVWMPNSRLALQSWFALNCLGAAFVAINTAYRGRLLSHVIENSDAQIMIAHPDLADRLLELEHRGCLRIVYTTAQKVQADAQKFERVGLTLRAWDELQQAGAGADLPIAGLKPWTTQAICYTSGTTGASKGVVSTFRHLYTMGKECLYGVDATDRYLVNLPLFHVGGTLVVYGAVARDAAIALIASFKTDTFLAQCKELGATCTILLGAMAGFLLGQPPGPNDKDHLLRRVMVVPLSDDGRLIHQRFGFNVYTVFNMSETSCPLRSADNPSVRGACGNVRPGMQARIVDVNDIEVTPGNVGELVLRGDDPWTLAHEYYKAPEATARAWRNGWFHTGDAFRLDDEGNYIFVDRVKDSIRRRGENVSSFEVEAEVIAFPGVLEVAAVGVPNAVAEEDIMIVVVPKPDHAIDNGALIEFLAQRLPHFMVPRYIRQITELPKTPTSKVEKHVLRTAGITAETWDREQAGIHLRRETLRTLG